MQLAQVADGGAAVVLERRRSGHYVADGAINGQPIRFLVDTGATDVAISDRVARAMGLEFGPRMTVMTAAGPVRGWQTRLDSVQLGALALTDVRATIAPGLGNQALLGMSFLKHFSLVQQGEKLVIASPGVMNK
jgi:aspartyl protease family protein